MSVLRVKNWSEFQHYKDRDPPWIKLHRALLDNRDFHRLSPLAGKLLPLVWLIASERGGALLEIDELAFRLRISEEQCEAVLKDLEEKCFIVSDEVADDAPQPSVGQQRAEMNGFSSRHIPDKVKRAVWDRDEGKCVQCGAEENIEYDHKHPVSKGGTSDEGNVQLLCRTCNRKKRVSVPAEQVATPAQPTSEAAYPEAEAQSQERKNAAADERARLHAAREAVIDELGVRDDPNWLGDAGMVGSWLNSGADLELDILPTIRRVMARRGQGPPRSLSYFNQAIADAMATRTKPLPPGKPTANGSKSAPVETMLRGALNAVEIRARRRDEAQRRPDHDADSGHAGALLHDGRARGSEDAAKSGLA